MTGGIVWVGATRPNASPAAGWNDRGNGSGPVPLPVNCEDRQLRRATGLGSAEGPARGGRHPNDYS